MLPEFNEDSPSVQAHLQMIQSVIQRMATNSSSCKAWSITLVSAILVVIADKGKSQYASISLIPIFLFYILDVYYLSLEKRFRESYRIFIKKLYEQKLTSSDLYQLSPAKEHLKHLSPSAKSFSTLPFYLTLTIMVIIVKLITKA